MSTRTTPEPGTSSVDTDLTLYLVEADRIEAYWPELEPLLMKSVEASSGLTTLGEVHHKLINGLASCFIFMKSNRIRLAVVVDIVQYATYRSARIFAIGGERVRDAMQFLPALEAWCLGAGCVEIEGWCNPVLKRFWRRLGMREKVTMMTLDLRRKLQ